MSFWGAWTLSQRVAEEVGLQGGEGGGEGNGLLGTREEGGEAGGEGNVGAGGAGDGFPELGGVGRFAEEAGFAFVEAVLEGAVAAGAVRVQEVAVFLVALPDGGDDGTVAHDCAGDVFPEVQPAVAVQVQDAGEVAGIAHVHRVGEGADAQGRRVGARLQVLEEDVVPVVRRDEAVDGKAHPLGHEGGADVAEVSAGHADDQAVGLAQARELRVAVEIVERLRQEAGDVDAVGRCQPQGVAQVGIEESGLDQRLAVVEAAIDLQGGDVLPQGCELRLLHPAHASPGVQDEDVRAGNAQKAVRDGAPGVTGGGDEDIDIPLVGKMPQEPRHETGADVLERERRPMEEFQGVNPFFHRHGRAVESEGFRDDAVQLRAGNVLAEESGRDFLPDLDERAFGKAFDPIGGKSRNPLRHVESAVFRQTLDDGLREGSVRRLMFCTVILHVSRRSAARPGWKP